MNRPFTMEDIRDLLELHATPLEGIDETEHEWNLGQVSIHKKRQRFRVGYGHTLKPDSKFYRVEFDFGAKHGFAVVFQAFDPKSSNPDRPEYVVGWVPPERERDVDRWIAFLNAEIANRVGHDQDARERAVKRGDAICLGIFKELGYQDDPSAPSLWSVRGKRGQEHKAEVVAYLLSGRTTAFYMGIDADIFDEKKTADTRSAMTDGTYSWPRLLAYYVENYDVALPQEFEDHMRKNNWRVPNEA